MLIEPRPGYGRACALGATRAVAQGATVGLFLDGDGADPAELAGRLVGPVLADEADFVLASRTRGQREPGSMGPHQVLAGRLIGGAIGLVSGVRYSDMSAFRAIRLDRLAALGMRELTYGWNLEMQMRAARAGLRRARSAAALSPARRRAVQGGGEFTGDAEGRVADHRHVSARLAAHAGGRNRKLMRHRDVGRISAAQSAHGGMRCAFPPYRSRITGR